jgi:hypothetical protein
MGWVNEPEGSGIAVSQKTFQLTAPTPDTAYGYTLADYEAMRITITASRIVTVNSLTVVWYRPSGQEISSGGVSIGQVITAGQSLAFLFDESMGTSPNPPPGAATCSVIGWG